jgi:hypothetical protein
MQSQTFTIGEIESFASKFYAGRALLLTPYGYNLTFSALAAGSTASQTLNIAANADFIALVVHHRANVAAAGQNVSTKTAPLARILITDSGSNEQFTNSAVDLENYSTNGNIINTLPYPRIISGRSTLTVQLTNFDASQTYNVDIFIEGVLVRAYSN